LGMAAMRTPTSLASLMSWRERIRSGFSKEAWRMGMVMGRLTRRNEGAGEGGRYRGRRGCEAIDRGYRGLVWIRAR